MIWLKVKIPLPKFVVMIYRLSFLWPLKRTVHFFYRSDNFALPPFFPSSVITRSRPNHLIRPNLQKIPRLFHLKVSAFGFHELLLH